MGQTSALPRCTAKDGTGGELAGVWTCFLCHRVMSQQFFPAREAQKPISVLPCQGTRLGCHPAACRQHLAGIWQGTERGLAPLAAAWEPAAS